LFLVIRYNFVRSCNLHLGARSPPSREREEPKARARRREEEEKAIAPLARREKRPKTQKAKRKLVIIQ
jgi:hypothetical protein